MLGAITKIRLAHKHPLELPLSHDPATRHSFCNAHAPELAPCHYFPKVSQLRPCVPSRSGSRRPCSGPRGRCADADDGSSGFRSRWQNFQVDLLRDAPLRELPTEAAPNAPTPRAAPNNTRSFFKTVLLSSRRLAGGWEASNERRSAATESSAETSFFAAPSIALFYDREVGPWNVSLRYSAGYVYFFTPDYLGPGETGIHSQTAAADILYRGTRLDLRSNATASYGSGFDIERSGQSDRFVFTELLAADYQVGEFTRAGANAGVSYALYPSDSAGPEDSQSRFSSSIYGDYFWTGRTRLRLELGAGTENQSTGGSSIDRSYTQTMLRVNYRATEKLTVDAGLGFGVIEDTNPQSSGKDGFRTIYTLSLAYAPTEKTSALLYFGLDATNIRPEFSLAVNWHPRENTYASLSIYQRTNLSTLVLAEDRTTRGILASLRQRLFGRVELGLGGGYELEKTEDDQAGDDEGFYFVAASLAWQMNAWAAWQLESRVSSRRDQGGTEDDGLQTRASVSFRLTF